MRVDADSPVVSLVRRAGYMLTQIPGGWVTARLGGRKVMPAGVTLWSVATAAVPLLAGTLPGVPQCSLWACQAGTRGLS